jgi:hypothetical protein
VTEAAGQESRKSSSPDEGHGQGATLARIAQCPPRFPEGLTLLADNGQFQDSTGNIIQEGSKLLILLYPFSKDRSALVDEVRAEYKSAFQQESVLRVDEHSCVSL